MNSPACAPCMHSTPQPLCSSKKRRRPSHGLCELCSCVTRLPHRPEQRQRGPHSNTSEGAGQNSGRMRQQRLAIFASTHRVQGTSLLARLAAVRELTYSVVCRSKALTAANREWKVDQPDLRLNPKVTLRPTTPMPQAELTESQHRLYDSGPLDQTNTKANNFCSTSTRRAPRCASEQGEGG